MSAGEAPADPRTDLPAFGSLPVVADVDACATRVIAPNASPMTLDGTNTYVLAAEDGGGAFVLDPGPDDPDHLDRVRAVLADRDLDVAGVVVTHHHVDHAEAARAWADGWQVDVVAATREVAGPTGRLVAAGDSLVAGGLALEVVATPGHTGDSISLRLPTGAVCTGDHVLGRGTTVVAHPDGDLPAYLDSLRRTIDLGPAALLVGHGPAVTEDPVAVLEFHLAHRAHRLEQVVDVVAEHGPVTVMGIVEVVYAAYDRAVWPAARLSTLAAIDHLVAEGRLRADGDRVAVP